MEENDKNLNSNEENEIKKEEETKRKEEDMKEIFMELEKLKEEKEKLLNDWKRARAELINYKREEEERFKEVIKFANERIIKELIVVLDNFELALNNLKEEKDQNQEKYLKGIILIKSQLEDLLIKEGVEEIKVNKGDIPDLKVVEIVSEIENPNYKPGTVAEIFQKGYFYNGKLIRPVRVAVAKSET